MSRKQSDPSEEFPTMQTVRFERDNTVGRIVLANPPFNRLDLRFSECLRQAVHDASESDIRVVLVKAEGPHFSFGGEVREWPGKDINWFRTFVAEVNLSYRAIEALRVPTIAAVQGGRVRRRFRACSQLRLHRGCR
jgi:enoyl-CoA hydratase/carnithine racemase